MSSFALNDSSLCSTQGSLRICCDTTLWGCLRMAAEGIPWICHILWVSSVWWQTQWPFSWGIQEEEGNVEWLVLSLVAWIVYWEPEIQFGYLLIWQEDAIAFKDRCDKLHGTEMAKDDELNLKLIRNDIDMYIKGLECEGSVLIGLNELPHVMNDMYTCPIVWFYHHRYVYPISTIMGLPLDFHQLIDWMQFKNLRDYECYVSRLKALPSRVWYQKIFEYFHTVWKRMNSYCNCSCGL